MRFTTELASPFALSSRAQITPLPFPLPALQLGNMEEQRFPKARAERSDTTNAMRVLGSVLVRVKQAREVVDKYKRQEETHSIYRDGTRRIAGEVKGSTFPALAKMRRGREFRVTDKERRGQSERLKELEDRYAVAKEQLERCREPLTRFLEAAIKHSPHIGLILANRMPLVELGSLSRNVAFVGHRKDAASVTAQDLLLLHQSIDYHYGYANGSTYSSRGLGVHKSWDNYNEALAKFGDTGYSRATLRFKSEEEIPKAGSQISIPQIVEAILEGRFH